MFPLYQKRKRQNYIIIKVKYENSQTQTFGISSQVGYIIKRKESDVFFFFVYIFDKLKRLKKVVGQV